MEMPSVFSAELEGQHPTAHQDQAAHLDQGEGVAEEQRADQRDQSDPDGRPDAVRHPDRQPTLEHLGQQDECADVSDDDK